MTNSRLIRALKTKRAEIEYLKSLSSGNDKFKGWRAATSALIRRAGVQELADAFDDIRYSPMMAVLGSDNTALFDRTYRSGLGNADGVLAAVIEHLEQFSDLIEPAASVSQSAEDIGISPIISIQMIQVANQMTEVTSLTEIANSSHFAAMPDSQKQELAEQLEVLQNELSQDNPSWEVIKRVLSWALNFGRDVFLQILPYILAKTNHIT